MLHLYYGRENLDKDKFLFDRIGAGLQQNQKILLLVPDQFTLQAERNAFACLGVDGLIDLEVMSQSRLALRVLAETGGGKRTHIDKYGRHILLAKILSDEKDNLEAFRGMNQRSSFIEMANNLISEMKQFNTSPDELMKVIGDVEQDSILHRKLTDIHKIYTKYEELIEGKYTDTEDYLDLFASKIKESKMVRNSVIWIDGFDYFTPKTLKIIEHLMAAVIDIHIVMTSEDDHSKSRDRELFELTRGLLDKLASTAEAKGIPAEKNIISEAYQIPVGTGETEKAEALAHLERELYSYPNKIGKADQNIALCRAANIYAEAETAAAKIVRLVREEGLRYRDIVVICNDMETRASVIKRVFADYGINAFLDKKRDILHHPSIEFISALIDISVRGWQYEDVFRLLKTDLTPLEPEDYEDLENYAVKYRIKGKRWSSDFKYGSEIEGSEFLTKINLSRSLIYDFITSFEKVFKKSGTVKEKTSAIYNFLKGEAQLPVKIEGLIDYLISRNQYEYAEETAQIWGVILHIFDQLVELIGDEELLGEEYGDMLKAGFEAVEIGLLPPTTDQVIVGTMQRTRIGKVKALLVLGANDGLLPAAAVTDSLLNEDEKTVLFRKGIEICKIDDLRAKEEKLAIYRTLSRPSRYLWMGYSASDIEGKESRQSVLLDKIKKLYTDLGIGKDILNEEDPMLRIETPGSALKHLTEAFRNALDGEPVREEWKAAFNWYDANSELRLKAVTDGIFFSNKQEKIEKELIGKLYRKGGAKELTLSPSRLERFSRCPFAHFINYGIRPDEQRIFEIAGREIGDVYHQCLMQLSDQLTVPGLEINDPLSPWMTMTKEKCQRRIDELIDSASQEYKEGVLSQGEEERYRGQRMKKVCGNAAWALVEHVQRGRVEKVYFESEFGKSPEKQFPPIEIKLGDQKVLIEGKIDRVDILKDAYVKIIDYKSGKERFDTEEAKAGWRLQLMLYLRAVMGAKDNNREETEHLKPAGVFYFEIAEPQIDATGLSGNDFQDKVENEYKKSFKLDGVVLDNAEVIESIAGEFSGYSDIIPVRKTKEGGYAGTTEQKLLKEEEFSELLDVMDTVISGLSRELAEGSIEIKPKKVKDETACKYCLYKSICNFDVSFGGCSYNVVK